MLKQQEDEFELQSQIQLEGFQDELLTKLKLKENFGVSSPKIGQLCKNRCTARYGK